MKLSDILTKFEQLDNEEIFFENDAIKAEFEKELAESLKDKIDSWYDYLAYLEAKAAAKKITAEKYAAQAQAALNSWGYLKMTLAKTMDAFDWKSLKGNEHELKLITQRKFLAKIKPSEENVKDFGDFIIIKEDVSYKWNMDKLREKYTENPDAVKELADWKEIKFIKF